MLEASETSYHQQWDIPYLRGIPYRAHILKFLLIILEDSLCIDTLQNTNVCICVCVHGFFLHCYNLNPPHLEKACTPMSNHCINTATVEMKQDPNRCISLCFGKKILQPHLQYPLFWDPPFPPPSADFSVSGNVFGFYGAKQYVIIICY